MDPAGLPDRVVHHPLRREAALARGVEPRELAGALWQSPHRGIHQFSTVDATQPVARARAGALLLPPGGAVSGWASLHLHGVTTLDGLEADGSTELPVLLCLPPDTQIRSRRGIAVWRGRLEIADATEVDGYPVTTPVRACFDQMRRSRDLTEAVVVADAALRSGVVDASELTTYVATHPGWPGVPTARKALELMDGRAESPPETRTRMLWMLRANLPRPLVNVPVYDEEGILLGIPDLLDDEAGVCIEYDGSHHRELSRHTKDNLREELLEHHGLLVVRVTSVDLYAERRRTCWRMQKAHQRGLARPRTEGRWQIRPGSQDRL